MERRGTATFMLSSNDVKGSASSIKAKPNMPCNMEDSSIMRDNRISSKDMVERFFNLGEYSS
jgi:hypothetical protein